MKRFFILFALLGAALSAHASEENYPKLDTTKVYEMEVVEVLTTAAKRTTPAS